MSVSTVASQIHSNQEEHSLMAGYSHSGSFDPSNAPIPVQSYSPNPNHALPRRAAPQQPQPRVQSQHSDTLSTTSSQASLAQGSGTRTIDTRATSEILGKTSGWYHGSKYDVTNLISAVEHRNNSDLKACLKAGLNVNSCRWVKDDKHLGNGSRSIVDTVASRNDINAMRMLIEYKVDLSGTPAATYASSSVAQSRYNFLFKGDDKKTAEKDLWTTPLHLACKYGYLEMVRVILEEGRLDPNARDSQQRVALHLTGSGSGSLDVAKLLLKMGALVDPDDNSAAKPLALAALHGRVDLVKLLMDHGAFIDSVDTFGETAIYNASLQDHFTTISTLTARGGNVNIRNIVCVSPFFKAASKFKAKTMEVLTECGADVDSRDLNGCTALARATMAKNVPLVMHLLQLGADIDADDYDGWSPLFIAMILKDEGLVHLLLRSGANLSATDKHYNVALSQAAILGSTSAVRHILSVSTIKTNQPQINLVGETALALACKYNNSPIVKLLLKHGDDPHHVDPNGYRALDRAMYWGNFACVRLLLEASVNPDGKSLFALQQGRLDNPQVSDGHDAILNYLRSSHPQLVLPSATPSSGLRDLFARPVTTTDLVAHMRVKQGKPAQDPVPPKDSKNGTPVPSPDPFEACIPESPITQIINNHITNINAKGGIGALDVGAAGANIALNVTSAILGL